MFNLAQSIMGGRNDNSIDPPRLKRPLPVIEEQLDEDAHLEEGNTNRISQPPNIAEHSDGVTGSGTRSPTPAPTHTAGRSGHKTRKKAISTHLPPSLDSLHTLGGNETKSETAVLRNTHSSGSDDFLAKMIVETAFLSNTHGSGSDDFLANIKITGSDEILTKGRRHTTPLRHTHSVISDDLKNTHSGSDDTLVNTNSVSEQQQRDTTQDESGKYHPSDSGTEGDLSRLKDTANKLNLKTRRPSYLTWRAEYVDKQRDLPEVKVISTGDERLTQERKMRIDHDLAWIKGQLIDLRRQDQSLARQLLGIRHELSNLRLAVSCEEHKDLLDDAQDHVEELRELSRFVDFPPELLSSSPLRQIGVTKMNLSSRRFSTC